MTIEKNILSIRDRIKNACLRSNREYKGIKLIAATKTVNIEMITEAIKCGIDILGENKVQEIVDKYSYVSGDVNWHMIGHLQTNKVKYISDKVSMIQSVDSIKLAEEIDRRFEKCGRKAVILIEINSGMENSKHGINPLDAVNIVTEISKYKNINISGIMVVAPAFDDKERVRPYFKNMKTIYDNIKNMNIKNVNMNVLSMGMTGDFEIAVEEGSNMVRIGSGIFGQRNIK